MRALSRTSKSSERRTLDDVWRARAGTLLETVPALTACGLWRAPRALIEPALYTRLLDVGGELPPAFSFGCFECRLDDDARVDVLACATRADGGDTAWLDSARPGDAPLLSNWAQPGTTIGRAAAAVWLEYDVTGGVRAPFAFLRLRQRAAASSPPVARVVDALAKVLGVRFTTAQRDGLERVERALPHGSRLLHVALRPHGEDALRLHFALPPGSLLQMLGGVAWPGDRRSVRSLLAGFVEAPRVGVQLEIREALAPSVDLEFFLDSAPSEDRRWRPMLDLLLERRLALPHKLAAAVAWIDEERVLPWPRRLFRQLQLKVRVREGAPLSAKCYLGFTPRFWLG